MRLLDVFITTVPGDSSCGAVGFKARVKRYVDRVLWFRSWVVNLLERVFRLIDPERLRFVIHNFNRRAVASAPLSGYEKSELWGQLIGGSRAREKPGVPAAASSR